MVDEPESLTLRLQRRMGPRLQAMDVKLDRVLDDVHDPKVRIAPVEEGMAGIHCRMDILDVRVDRIERWLELVDVAR